MKIDEKKVKSILFVTLNNLGDIILTTPVFLELCRNFPGAVIDVMTGSAGEEIFVSHRAVRRVDKHRRRLSVLQRIPVVRALRKKRYDLVIDLKNSLLPNLIGARYHRSLMSLILEPVKRKIRRHKKEEHLARLADLGIEASVPSDFYIPEAEENKKYICEVMGSRGKAVILNPGSKSHLKRWPAEKFAELGDRLSSELGCGIFLIGNEADKEVVERVKRGMKSPFVDLCCRTSVSCLYSVMKRSVLVVTGDSAPLHVASAVGVPAVAIFASTDEVRYGPLSAGSEVVVPAVECRPCNLANCALGRENGCITDIGTEEVYSVAKEILEFIAPPTSVGY
ncbi:MAG: glycosyltransferase family 9 protein [Candidatus Omnitrophica bacterium]|nr:glycosyltransferase family 9 protein [Candidatus Omnitrophota bacterium]